MNYYVCLVKDIPRGEMRAFTIKNIPMIVVHSQEGSFYAIYRICPHQRGDLYYGLLGGLTDAMQPGKEFEYIREGEILRCPWHSFSYDVTTGTCFKQHLKSCASKPIRCWCASKRCFLEI